MAKRRRQDLSGSIGTLIALAPAVAGTRLARAGSRATRAAHDTTLWWRLSGEKVFAAQEAWLGAAGVLFQLQQRALAAWLDTPSPWPAATALGWWQQRQVDAQSVAAAALAPLARRVRRNARRPGR